MRYIDSYLKFTAEKIEADHKDSGTLYVYDSATHTGFSITGVASILCTKLDGKRPLRVVLKEIEGELGVAAGVYDQAVADFLADLEARRLFVVLTPEGPG